jgi:hypothetical protein
MKCREPTRLHWKSGFVEGIEPKSVFLKPFTCRRLVVCSKETWATHSKSGGWSLFFDRAIQQARKPLNRVFPQPARPA